jgi:16S rRNA (adenine1518-N6/adenine1519-N6)-dimethyltransferase
MTFVHPKKSLGQHFLKDKNIAQNIVKSLLLKDISDVVEIGPGMGVLTHFLMENEKINLYVVEIDRESVAYLKENLALPEDRIIHDDFINSDLLNRFNSKIAIIGNLPYNISSQIFFKVLDYRDTVSEVVCMIQKEVAERISAPPGSKTYGILSVFLQAYYNIEYLFTVHENVFIPPPKVKSAVIRLTRNSETGIDCDEVKFRLVVKTAFNQRRKTLRNSLKSLLNGIDTSDPVFDNRPERLSVADFVAMTKRLS